MRTVNYSDLLRGSAGLAGVRLLDVSVEEFALWRTFHDKRLQEAWEMDHWPEVCRLEQRTFRPLWNAAYTYAAGDERYDLATGQYFQALQASTGEAPTIAGVENSAYWAECNTSLSGVEWSSGAAYAVGAKVRNPADQQYYQCIVAHTSGATLAADQADWGLRQVFDRYIGYEQVEDDGTARTVVGEFLRAFDASPKLTTKVVEFPFELSENGAQFTTLRHAIAFAWVYFRLRRPLLTGEAWDQAATYASGDQVYFVDAKGVGNFWTANDATAAAESPATTPAKWDAVELPYFLRGYLITGGYTDWLRSDGQGDKADGMEGMALHFLELEADKLHRQSGQGGRLRWVR